MPGAVRNVYPDLPAVGSCQGGMVPLIQEAVQGVKAASDIVDVVGGYLSLRQTGKVYKALCPFHDDSRPSLDIDPERQRFRCWSCGQYGDVISFVQQIERLDFAEAMDLLGRRAGITWRETDDSLQSAQRARMLEQTDWAQKHFQEALWDRHTGQAARDYLEERGLEEETLRIFGVGWAPPGGDWLLRKSEREGKDRGELEALGILACHENRYYDRFRERVIFPIRNARGQTVGFGGRVLPGTPTAERAPKYYNSADSALFTKSEQLFGLDLAREDARKRGYLAVVEGYTDVLMAHQHGIGAVVATMGTALNHRHLAQLKRHTSEVVLVFDADAGGDVGVERALSLFAQHEMELRVARLPDGLDPCDWLLNEGAGPLNQSLTDSKDALAVAMERWFPKGVEERVGAAQQALDRVLGLMGESVPHGGGSATAIKRNLLVGRLARRLGLREETIWKRQEELAKTPRGRDPRAVAGPERQIEPVLSEAGMPMLEKELLAVLFSHPEWVEETAALVDPRSLTHPIARGLYENLLGLVRSGSPVTMDALRPSLSPQAHALVLRLADMGQSNSEPRTWWDSLIAGLANRLSGEQGKLMREELGRLSLVGDHDAALEMLRKVQELSRKVARP